MFKERFKDASNQIFFFVGNVSDDDIKMIAKYLNHLPTGGEQKNETNKNIFPKLAEGVNHGLAQKGSEPMSIVYILGETDGFEATQRNRRMVDIIGECLQITTTTATLRKTPPDFVE